MVNFVIRDSRKIWRWVNKVRVTHLKTLFNPKSNVFGANWLWFVAKEMGKFPYKKWKNVDNMVSFLIVEICARVKQVKS